MTTGPVIPVRPASEILRAHDLLAGYILDEVDIGLSDKTKERLSVACSALCWALRHDCNADFAALLASLEVVAKMHGYTFDQNKPKDKS